MTSFPPRGSNPHDTPSRKPARILVVDDQEFMRDLLTETLRLDDYEVITAADGQDAVDLLERERFDLVITDMVMPRLSGAEVMRSAKRIDPQIPVIVMTGYPSVEDATRLVREGAADYITKPFSIDAVRVAVAKHLELRRRGENLAGSSHAR